MNEWNEVTQENMEILKSCGPDERCLVYGDKFVKMPISRINVIMEVAFKDAYAAALKLADPSALDDDFQVDVDDIEMGQTFLRVTLTDNMGRQTSGIGAFPDPEVH